MKIALATLLLCASAAALAADAPPTSKRSAASPPPSEQSAASPPSSERSAASPGASERSAICRADIEKLCPSVEPGKGRIARCLKRNEAQVSQPCKDELAQAHTRKKSGRSAVPKG